MKVHILKLGGELLERADTLTTLSQRIAQCEQPLIIVHGGGRRATELARHLGIEARFHRGRRITDRAMLEVVAMTTAGLLNKHLVAALLACGVRAVGIAALDGNTIHAVRRVEGDIDFGYVGIPHRADCSLLCTLLASGWTPVVAPLTHDGAGQLLNTNADTVAAAIAAALARDGWDVELSLCTATGGVLDGDGRILPQLTQAECAALAARGTITSGMLPKLDAAFEALQHGVRSVAIIDAELLPQRCGTYINSTEQHHD